MHLFEVPRAHLVPNADATLAAGWAVTQRFATEHRERTTYEIGAWRVEDAAPVATFVFVHSVDFEHGDEHGGRVLGVEFSADGCALVVRCQPLDAFSEPEEVRFDLPAAT